VKQIRDALTWLMRVKTDAGWGGNWHTDAPSVWTNVSLCWLLAKYGHVYLTEELDSESLWALIRSAALDDLAAESDGRVPISRSGRSAAYATAPTAYGGLLLSELRNTHWGAVPKGDQRIVTSLACKITGALVDAHRPSPGAHGWTFALNGSRAPVSVVSTCLALRALRALVRAWGTKLPPGQLQRARKITEPTAVEQALRMYMTQSTTRGGLPLQVGCSEPMEPDVAATAAGILALATAKGSGSTGRLGRQLAVMLVDLLARPLQQNIELTSDLGPFHWFGLALALLSLA